MSELPKALDHRQADHDIESIFVERWSPRAMTGEAITPAELNRLFEAARWAPSSYNEQPWRFLYARRDTPHWQKFFDLLLPANQAWASTAGALMLLVSNQNFSRNQKPNRVHVFDAGSAWENLALQGSRMGLVVHGMAGFDVDKAKADLNVPGDFSVIAMIAVGRPGDPSKLHESLQGAEKPTGRKKVAEIAIEGGF